MDIFLFFMILIYVIKSRLFWHRQRKARLTGQVSRATFHLSNSAILTSFHEHPAHASVASSSDPCSVILMKSVLATYSSQRRQNFSYCQLQPKTQDYLRTTF